MKKIYLIVLTALSVVILSWFLPWIYSIAFPVGSSDPFVAYSPVADRMIVSESGADGEIYEVDSDGNRVGGVLSKEERDSLLPQIYFTQLMSRDQMPDSLKGKELSVQALKHGQWVFSSLPRDINKVHPEVHLIMESMPRRIDLEDPEEVFRFRDGRVEFVDMATNEVNRVKSERFSKIFKAVGLEFPMRSFSANITSRKPYDEGYLMTDAAGALFHLKMRAGCPYMMRIDKPDTVKIADVFVMENVDTRHLGLVTDENDRLYVLEREGYRLVPLEVGTFDAGKSRLMIVKNLFNWVVRITDDSGVRWVALDSDDYSPLAVYRVDNPQRLSEQVASYIFPFTLSFSAISDCYAWPRVENFSWHVIFFNIVLAAVLFLVYIRRRLSPGRRLVLCALTLVVGIYLFIPLIIIKD